MKNYKILRIAGIHYSSIVKSWLRDKPEYETSSYDEMHKRFFNESIMYSNGFSRSLKELGQDAHEIIVDFEIIQKQWARENNVLYTKGNWLFDIMMSQIKQIKPDVVYIQSHVFTIPGLFIKEKPNLNLIAILKEAFPFIKTTIIFSGYPSHINRIEGADIFFTSDLGISEYYKGKGLDSIVMHHSFDDHILQQLKNKSKKHDFTFIGSSRAPESRYWALRQLMDETELQSWIYDKPKNTHIFKSKKNLKQLVRDALKQGFQLFGDHWVNTLADAKHIPEKFRNIFLDIKRGPVSPLIEIFPDKCHPPVIGIDMYNLLHHSKITFNKHADLSFGNVGNMRMFEATGAGTCLVTDTGHNMDDLFEPDKEVVTYSSVDEAVEKVNYLQNHPDEAEQIAKAGHARTLKDHTIMNRCQLIDESIQKFL